MFIDEGVIWAWWDYITRSLTMGVLGFAVRSCWLQNPFLTYIPHIIHVFHESINLDVGNCIFGIVIRVLNPQSSAPIAQCIEETEIIFMMRVFLRAQTGSTVWTMKVVFTEHED